MSEINDLFVTAAKSKYRFSTSSGSGQISVEDLWDLPLTGKGVNLDDIAKGVYRDLKQADGEISFVKPAVKTTTELQAKLDIVKYVIEVKMAERDAAAAAADKAALKQKLLGVLARKQDAALEEMTEEQIQAAIAGL